MYTTFSEVVVGFDGSTNARRALEWGVRESIAWQARLGVLVAADDYSHGTAETTSVYRDWARNWAAQADQLLRSSAAAGWEVSMPAGNAHSVLMQASRPDTITVVGSDGHGIVSGAVLDSVSQHLARHAAGPVVVVRGGQDLIGGNVVVGIDGSPASQRALDFGLAHANAHGLRVTAVYGWEASFRKGTPLAGDIPVEVSREIMDAERWVAEAVSGHRELYPDIKLEGVAFPRPPARGLVEMSCDAAILVVGSRGRGAVAEALLGSVSQAVLRKAQCPVAIVH